MDLLHTGQTAHGIIRAERETEVHMRDYQRELEALREKIARRRDDIAVLESLRRQE